MNSSHTVLGQLRQQRVDEPPAPALPLEFGEQVDVEMRGIIGDGIGEASLGVGRSGQQPSVSVGPRRVKRRALGPPLAAEPLAGNPRYPSPRPRSRGPLHRYRLPTRSTKGNAGRARQRHRRAPYRRQSARQRRRRPRQSTGKFVRSASRRKGWRGECAEWWPCSEVTALWVVPSLGRPCRASLGLPART